MSTDTRVVNDEISGWLEDYVRPESGKARREFQRQYLCIYDRWSRYHAAAGVIEDQVSLNYLMASAEDALREIASGKPARLWLSIVRSLPLPVVRYIALPNNAGQLVDLVKIASSAACLYCDGDPLMFVDENALRVTPDWLEAFKQNLPIDLPRFLGAAHTWYYAKGWYRIAGKGGKLAPPMLFDLAAATDALDRLAPTAIMVVPGAIFTNSDEIMPQVEAYDRRSSEVGSSSITGFLSRDAPTGQTDPLSWWRVGLQSDSQTEHELDIFYPLQNRTLVTNSYFPFPDQLKPHLDRLAPFSALMPARLGMDFESFGLCCRAVAAALRNQTGFMKLHRLPGESGRMRFRAEHATLQSETLGASFLFSVTQRGLLRAPKRAWLKLLTDLVAEGGLISPAEAVEAFVARFTRVRKLDSDFEPGLFLQVDPQTLALDLIAMSEFFDFCLRKITSLDDAPDPDARRGAHFEQAVWAFLSARLPIRLAVALNTVLRKGTLQGEIDVAFQVDDVLVVLECKSWQKSLGYFGGDRNSIERRHQQLRAVLKMQATRNVDLLLDRLGPERPRNILSFVCVAGSEFVWRDYPDLWYGTVPRIATPQELVTLISDAPRWSEAVAAARSVEAL